MGEARTSVPPPFLGTRAVKPEPVPLPIPDPLRGSPPARAAAVSLASLTPAPRPRHSGAGGPSPGFPNRTRGNDAGAEPATFPKRGE